MTKSKKQIQVEKIKAFKAKNLNQSGMFFTFRARQAFTKLRQVFIKAPILNHFDPEHHIHIERDASSYAIGKIFS